MNVLHIPSSQWRDGVCVTNVKGGLRRRRRSRKSPTTQLKDLLALLGSREWPSLPQPLTLLLPIGNDYAYTWYIFGRKWFCDCFLVQKFRSKVLFWNEKGVIWKFPNRSRYSILAEGLVCAPRRILRSFIYGIHSKVNPVLSLVIIWTRVKRSKAPSHRKTSPFLI